jgi:hypothetical protein
MTLKDRPTRNFVREAFERHYRAHRAVLALLDWAEEHPDAFATIATIATITPHAPPELCQEDNPE